jgi:hypothetical protein
MMAVDRWFLRIPTMRPQDVRDHLRKRPFEPFRLTLTDGRTYDVLHPDLAMVGQSTVAVGLARPDAPELVYVRLVTVALLHIVQIEPIVPSSAS